MNIIIIKTIKNYEVEGIDVTKATGFFFIFPFDCF